MNGIALHWTQAWDASFGRIQGEDGKRHKVKGCDVEPDSIGRRFLIVGEPVTFQLVSDPQKIRRAVNVCRPFRETRVSPANWKEICAVRDDRFLFRPLGGFLSYDIQELSWPIEEGNIVACGVEDQGFPTWRAVNLQFLAQDESSYEGPWDLNTGNP